MKPKSVKVVDLSKPDLYCLVILVSASGAIETYVNGELAVLKRSGA